VRRDVHLERGPAPADHQTVGVLEQGFPGRGAVGHLRAVADTDVQTVRTDTRRVAGQGEAGVAAEGLRLHHLRVGEEREGAAAVLHQRLCQFGKLVLQDQLEEDEGEGGRLRGVVWGEESIGGLIDYRSR
jgi:hypothetical protein